MNKQAFTAITLMLSIATGVFAADKAAVKTPAKDDEKGFVPLFNGKDLTGWVGAIDGYGAKDGIMFCKKGGNLYTEKEYGDFILKFDFKFPSGANNGLGIRAPLKGDAAYKGMELQILDNTAPRWANLKPWQYHGSIYGVVAAKRGFLKKPNVWNSQVVYAIGPKIKVVLNGTTIIDADLDKVIKEGDPKNIKRHPGLKNKKGHIGWLGHGARVEFRNIRIKDMTGTLEDTKNTPPKGFVALFNGKDLTGWKGLVANPKKRAAMSPKQLAEAQKKADANMKKNWTVEDGALVFSGKGLSLCTAKDYGDFEMYVDWKIKKNGDSGIYLRGSPQVQIWDPARWPVGSGGLYNNKKNPSKPLVCADNPIGQWNRFRIKMIGEKVWVWLNGKLVVDNTILENYWDRKQPIYPTGQIELQNHGNTLWFKNIYIREIKKGEK